MTESRDPAAMSDAEDAANPAALGEERDDDPNAAAIRALLKRTVAAESAEPTPDLLPGVQRRIRRRSRGKFFADGWSTTQARASYVLAGILTVALAVLAYLALGPMPIG